MDDDLPPIGQWIFERGTFFVEVSKSDALSLGVFIARSPYYGGHFVIGVDLLVMYIRLGL